MLVDSSTVICWTSPFVILGLSGLFCRFYSIFDGWMDDLQFYILFNYISVISGRWVDANERLSAMEPHLRLRRFRLERGLNSGPLDQ